MERWEKNLREYAPQEVKLVLAGTKADLDTKRDVSEEEAEAFAKAHGMTYFETSARTGQNVENAFLALTNLVMGIGAADGSTPARGAAAAEGAASPAAAAPPPTVVSSPSADASAAKRTPAPGPALQLSATVNKPATRRTCC